MAASTVDTNVKKTNSRKRSTSATVTVRMPKKARITPESLVGKRVEHEFELDSTDDVASYIGTVTKIISRPDCFNATKNS